MLKNAVERKVAIRILFDGQQLAKAFIQNQTGIFRVSDNVFRRLCRRNDVELHFLMTTSKGEPEKYLKSIGHPEIPIVHMPRLFGSTKYRGIIHKIHYGWRRLVMPFFYGDRLREFDVYFSPYAPISPIVYNCGIKTVYICHDIIPVQFPHFGEKYGKKMMENFRIFVEKLAADFIFFVSNSARRDFLTYRTDFPFEKTAVTYPGSDGLDDNFSNVSVRTKYNIPNGRYILALSESNPRKNFAHVIRSFVKYVENSSDGEIHLVIGGKKLPNSDYVGMTNGLFDKYKDRITITGYIADKDLAMVYKEATLFLYPSLYEGFGLPPLEAMKRGIPAIVADNSSLPEVCGDAAAYVSGFDDAETANAIGQVLSDETRQREMKEKGLRRAAFFSFDKMVDQIMEKIHELVENRGK